MLYGLTAEFFILHHLDKNLKSTTPTQGFGV